MAPLSERDLVYALRRRMLRDLNRKQMEQAQSEAPQHQSGGLAEAMLGEDDPYDYKVKITKKDLADLHPGTGKPLGWEKEVHRYREKKKRDPLE